MKKKISFIGAGSFGFTFKLVNDILMKPALADFELNFMDVDTVRLDNLKLLLNLYFQKEGMKKDVTYTTSLEDSVRDADFVFHITKIGGYDASVVDTEIPKKYGVFQTIGDTSSVAGISRGLRTMLFIKKLLDAVERLSKPGAVVLNYTNPQPMCVIYANMISKVPFIGLCHSVQGTTTQMANALDVPYDEITFDAAGINHLSFITTFEQGGEDLYPKFRSIAPELFAKQYSDEDHVMADLGRARIDLMTRFDYMVTESSQHLSEYVPYYLNFPEMVESLDLKIDLFKRNIARSTERFSAMIDEAKEGRIEIPPASVEYGPEIVNAMVTNQPCKIYGNVMNTGLIDNLPSDACVEVACLVDRNGWKPCRYGKLPTELAMLCSQQSYLHILAAQAAYSLDKKQVYRAMLADPIVTGKLNPNEIQKLTDEILQAQKQYLEGFDI